MKYVTIILLYVLFGCSKKEFIQKRINTKPNFILEKIDLQYYPSFSHFIGVEIDFKRKNLKVYNPSTYHYGIMLDTFNIDVKDDDLIKIVQL